MDLTILVTGSSGYLGSALCVALSEHYRVVGIDKRQPVGGKVQDDHHGQPAQLAAGGTQQAIVEDRLAAADEAGQKPADQPGADQVPGQDRQQRDAQVDPVFIL